METHVIKKSDLLQMILDSSQLGDSEVVVEVESNGSEDGDIIMFIDRVRYSNGQIRIVCHNDLPKPPEEDCDCDEFRDMTHEVRVFLTEDFGNMTPAQQLDCINKFKCEMGRFIE